VNSQILEILRCPVCGGRLKPAGRDADSQSLICGEEHSFQIRGGIPRFVDEVADADQAQGARSFGFKWQQLWGHDGKTRDFYRQWFLSRFGFDSINALEGLLQTKNCVLDAGAGNAQSARWYAPFIAGHWVGVDISSSVDVAQRTLPPSSHRDLVQADILNLPFADASFDAALSDGVLHHTRSTKEALRSVSRVLKPGGTVMFYVYRKKGPIREFTDDYVRDMVSGLPPEIAWEQLKPLTRLGESLAEMRATIRVPEDIQSLNIAAGEYDLQRFMYQHIVKMFWNDQFSFDENHHITFDWFHPRYAHRQTEEEVGAWCEEFGIDVDHQYVEVSGISIRGTKRRN
jgi:arsenite methyltransferase